MNAETWTNVKQLLDACLDLDPGQRAEYLNQQCAENIELRNEVDSLLAAHDQAGDFIENPVLRETFTGLSLGHWKIVSDIGEGGMSRVCLAERDDGQFQQRAAVKILKRGMDTDLILRHFQMERQILAGMRHPNVARLLDGGVTPDGRPYFVMEHIEGEPLDRYTESQKLSLAGQLKIFQQVCAAVHYAHQRLVVHRDIKPSNILVTPEGIAKLLDFGIATIISVEPSLGTLTSTQMLTPDYASPEQIRGEPVTTSSDVYSLGVLLYKLLSGGSPYGPRANQQELVRAICEMDPAAPSAASPDERAMDKVRRRGLSGDLDNIILKALEKDPPRRYSSAEQFSQDIERYLDGRTVLARRQTWKYRTSKFILRNKLGVAIAATIVFLLVAGVAATLWQARIAGMEHRLAEERFVETRQLANSMLFEIHDAIQELPGSTAARALIIQRSLKYLDRISAVAPGNAELVLELAEGYKRLGDVQGRLGDANLGQYAAARQSYQKALALLQQPDKDPALERKRRRLVALTQIRLGGYQGISESLDMLASLSQNGAEGTQALIDLATANGAMADLLVERRDLPRALTFRLKEYTLRKQVRDSDPKNITGTRNYALSSKRLGSLLWRMNRTTEAMDYYQAALRLEEGWAQLEPLSADAKMAVSFSQSDMGFLLWQQKRFKEALVHYRKTVEIRQELAGKDPNNARATIGLVSAYWRTASVSVAVGDIQSSLDLLKKAVKTLSQSKNPSPGTVQSETQLAHVLAVSGESYAAIGNTAAAQDWYRRSKQILVRLRAAQKLPADSADLLQSVEDDLAKLEKIPAKSGHDR